MEPTGFDHHEPDHSGPSSRVALPSARMTTEEVLKALGRYTEESPESVSAPRDGSKHWRTYSAWPVPTSMVPSKRAIFSNPEPRSATALTAMPRNKLTHSSRSTSSACASWCGTLSMWRFFTPQKKIDLNAAKVVELETPKALSSTLRTQTRNAHRNNRIQVHQNKLGKDFDFRTRRKPYRLAH